MQKILITGGTGLIGQRFCELYGNSYEIHILTRTKKFPDQSNIFYHNWDAQKNILDLKSIDPDYIVSLHGEGIADRRWSEKRKQEIIDSRVKPIVFLGKKLMESGIKPKAIIGAAAIGYYGHRPGEWLTEESQPGHGFLSKSCLAWEEAYQSLYTNAQRNVTLRLGTVLSRHGGALPKMMMTKFFRVFNYFGEGTQMMSWIHIDDVCHLIHASIQNPEYSGTINAVSPDPVTNKEFINSIKNTVGGFGLVFPVPAFIINLLLGEMASIVMDDTKVSQSKLNALGFQYAFPKLTNALKDLIS